MITEELVTRKLAFELVGKGHSVVAVHPPGGQGPFVIPLNAKDRRIERRSLHPDLVLIDAREMNNLKLVIGECKVFEKDLVADRLKLEHFANNRAYLNYAFFRLQKFNYGPKLGFDLDYILDLPLEKLPIQFVLAAASQSNRKLFEKIGLFDCDIYLYESTSLLTFNHKE